MTVKDLRIVPQQQRGHSFLDVIYNLLLLGISRGEDVVDDGVKEDTANTDGAAKQLDGVQRLAEHL